MSLGNFSLLHAFSPTVISASINDEPINYYYSLPLSSLVMIHFLITLQLPIITTHFQFPLSSVIISPINSYHQYFPSSIATQSFITIHYLPSSPISPIINTHYYHHPLSRYPSTPIIFSPLLPSTTHQLIILTLYHHPLTSIFTTHYLPLSSLHYTFHSSSLFPTPLPLIRSFLSFIFQSSPISPRYRIH